MSTPDALRRVLVGQARQRSRQEPWDFPTITAGRVKRGASVSITACTLAQVGAVIRPSSAECPPEEMHVGEAGSQVVIGG